MKKLFAGLLSLSLLFVGCDQNDIHLAERCQSSTVLIHMKLAKGAKRGIGTCSGVYVSPHLILTADHCVDSTFEEGAGISIKALWVKNIQGESAPAEVVKMDPVKDLALIKTKLRGTPVHLGTGVKVGETVWVVGMPLGLQWIVSKGIISQKDMEFQAFPVDHFVTTAIVLPGNSGGPAFNSSGELIGIVVMSTSLVGPFGASGLGIVVQINTVRDFLRHIK